MILAGYQEPCFLTDALNYFAQPNAEQAHAPLPFGECVTMRKSPYSPYLLSEMHCDFASDSATALNLPGFGHITEEKIDMLTAVLVTAFPCAQH